jgi:hypothetical protein
LRGLPRDSHYWIASANDDVDLRRNKFQGMLAILVRAQTVTAFVNYKILALDEALFPQRFIERDVIGSSPWTGVQTTELINTARLLRPRRERPRSNGTACDDEIAPPHCLTRASGNSSYEIWPAPRFG